MLHLSEACIVVGLHKAVFLGMGGGGEGRVVGWGSGEGWGGCNMVETSAWQEELKTSNTKCWY